MVPCVSLKWISTVSNHIWSICAQKFFFDVLNYFSFPDFCTNDFFILPVISQPLFPSLEIIFEWLRNIILVSKVNMTSKRLCSFWPVPRFLTFRFTVSGNCSTWNCFHFSSFIIPFRQSYIGHFYRVMNDFPWDRFFHNFFSHSLVFCF